MEKEYQYRYRQPSFSSLLSDEFHRQTKCTHVCVCVCVCVPVGGGKGGGGKDEEKEERKERRARKILPISSQKISRSDVQQKFLHRDFPGRVFVGHLSAKFFSLDIGKIPPPPPPLSPLFSFFLSSPTSFLLSSSFVLQPFSLQASSLYTPIYTRPSIDTHLHNKHTHVCPAVIASFITGIGQCFLKTLSNDQITTVPCYPTVDRQTLSTNYWINQAARCCQVLDEYVLSGTVLAWR